MPTHRISRRWVTCLACTGVMLWPSLALGTLNGVVDAYVETLGPHTIGQRTAYTAGPPLPPLAALIGPISTGKVTGQFDITCGGANGNLPTSCSDAVYMKDHFDWKWGLLQVDAYDGSGLISGQFVESGGKTLFASDVTANEGFTTVETQSWDGLNPRSRLAHFEFNLDPFGITLQPNTSYIFFAVLSGEGEGLPGVDRVPGEDPDPLFDAEGSIFQSSVLDPQPDQLHQNFIVFDPLGVINELATSRLIPIVPEPMSVSFFGLALIGALVKRRR